MKRRKKIKRTRTRDWSEDHEFSFTHDRAKHRRGETLPEPMVERGFVASTTEPNAVVVSHSGQWAFVRMAEDVERFCLVGEGLIESEATLLAPGDRVRVEQEGDAWFVRGIAARRTKLSRLALERSRLSEQLIAVNVDRLVIVASAAKPRFKPGLVDRYLIAAQVGGVEPLLCVNKMDLVTAEPAGVEPYRELGLDVVTTSCETGEGIAALCERLRGQLSVFAGHSGTGKSSLLNAMDPALDLDTQAVSDANEKGRHTTSASRLYRLEGDIRVIDTPGIRRLGVWGVTPEELAFYFPEMESLASMCRFHDCSHTHEPDCAVRDAVEAGTLSPLRYASYQRIRESLE
ncbi:MAG TPA: ribosome small subunit-dependent GTPase A [Candidatus Hydrogenedentes bacterium]|nr:ribosome small subunit-dependent GTPase A [Candidatus Hydrogenedentota bacterium]HPG65784.1 ribosome small subunit-dependent GTPase A [Candidatus Hydrogenedentota bacterium]